MVPGPRLWRTIATPHITFVFEPEDFDHSLLGEKIHVTVTSYGNDGANEGVKVILSSTNPQIASMIGEIAVPHITLSVAQDGQSVNTRYLDYEDLDQTYEFDGVFGGLKNSDR